EHLPAAPVAFARLFVQQRQRHVAVDLYPGRDGEMVAAIKAADFTEAHLRFAVKAHGGADAPVAEGRVALHRRPVLIAPRYVREAAVERVMRREPFASRFGNAPGIGLLPLGLR